MNEPRQECSLCHGNGRTLDKTGQICDQCADLLEFGYPSFPAYPLSEKTAEYQEVRLRKNGKRLQ